MEPNLESFEEIDACLRDIIPDLRRRACTHRVFEELGVNALLDVRNELLKTLEEFERVFLKE